MGSRGMGEPKHLVVWELRSYGVKWIDIAGSLYPREYEVWRRTRDRRLYLELVNRVHKLYRYALRKFTTVGEEALQQEGFTTIDYGGGERDRLRFREPEPGNVILKKIRNPGERQRYEYEQLMHRLYRRSGIADQDVDGGFWATVRYIHHTVFPSYYYEWREKVWTTSTRKRRDFTAGRAALAYIYSVFLAASMLHGRLIFRDMLFRFLREQGIIKSGEVEEFRDLVRKVGPLVFTALF